MNTPTHLNSFLADLQLRILIARWNECDSNWAKEHIVPSFDKLYLICEGTAWITLNDEKIIMKPGQLLLIPRGFKQSFAVIGQVPLVKYWCHFETNINLLSFIQLYGLPYVIDKVNFPMCTQLFEQLIAHNTTENSPSAPLIVKSALFQLLSHYLDQAITTRTKGHNSNKPPLLKMIMDHIDANLQQSINIQQLADSIHLHPNYFIPFFKKYVGTTPMRYIYKRRCEEARKILLNSNKTLGQIAHETGFNDVFHLSKSFKKMFGVSPSQFKSEHVLHPNSDARME